MEQSATGLATGHWPPRCSIARNCPLFGYSELDLGLGTWDLGHCEEAHEARSTTSQLVRSVFRGIMGAYEGAFSAEPAAVGTTHGGTGEARGAGGWVPDPPGHAKPGCALGNESPAARSAGGCQVVGAGPRPPELGRNWAQTEARGGWWGPGSAAGGGAAVSQGYLLSTYNNKVRELQQAFAAPIEPNCRAASIHESFHRPGPWDDRSTAVIHVGKAAGKR
jgi:hypothetical protein